MVCGTAKIDTLKFTNFAEKNKKCIHNARSRLLLLELSSWQRQNFAAKQKQCHFCNLILLDQNMEVGVNNNCYLPTWLSLSCNHPMSSRYVLWNSPISTFFSPLRFPPNVVQLYLLKFWNYLRINALISYKAVKGNTIIKMLMVIIMNMIPVFIYITSMTN